MDGGVGGSRYACPRCGGRAGQCPPRFVKFRCLSCGATFKPGGEGRPARLPRGAVWVQALFSVGPTVMLCLAPQVPLLLLSWIDGWADYFLVAHLLLLVVCVGIVAPISALVVPLTVFVFSRGTPMLTRVLCMVACVLVNIGVAAEALSLWSEASKGRSFFPW